jgi:hypothetical protein
MRYLFLLLLIAQCNTYRPTIDTAGRSGTFQEAKAEQITNDMQHCKQLADDNAGLFSNFGHMWKNNTGETKFESIYKKCMNNRGHSVVY